MNPERWRRIKDIFDQALDTPTEQRRMLVRSACVGDPELEAEVLQLLHAHDTSGEFLEESAADLHTFLQPERSGPSLQSGMVLARRFEVRRFINAGGMGEVYEAWDNDLDQAVALKTILPYIAENANIIERFKHEVKHAREVSHPNICRVHELFCDDDATGTRIWFLSMELLRGTTLLDRIRQKGSPSCEMGTLLAEQMLCALEAAHDRGLVHRDFKSNNVMLVEQEGAPPRAVVMDFGLAIGTLPGGYHPHDIAGTGSPGYMAPEQTRGEEIGPLADQYAFGVVLCEMTTGSLPATQGGEKHCGKPKGYPKRWQAVIRRCTQQKPADRFRNMAAVRTALLPFRWGRLAGWTAAALAIAAASFAALWRPAVPGPPPCTICAVEQITPDTDKSEAPSLSADGHTIAYSSDRAEPGNLDIFVQSLLSGQIMRITRGAARETTPSLSPDGKLVVFRSERDGGGIYLAETASAKEPRLLVNGGRNPKISPDGKSLLYWTGDPDSSVPSGRVYRIALNGGSPEPIAPNLADARNPVWNSDSEHILLTGCAAPGQLLPDCFDWWVAGVHGSTANQTHAYAALRASGFLPGRYGSLEWSGDQITFTAIGAANRLDLAAVTLNAQSTGTIGAPRWLLQGQAGDLEPSIAANNQIAFTRTRATALHIWRLSGVGDKKKPGLQKVTEDTDVDGTPFVAGGGRFLVFARGRSTKRSILMRDTGTGQESVIVNLGTPVLSPILDDAGRWVAYQQTETDGASAIYAGEIGGAMKRICRNCTEPSGWFGGNRYFFYRDSAHSVSAADPRTGQQITVLHDPSAMLGDASWSPANGYLALVSTVDAQRQFVAVHLNGTTMQPDGPVLRLTKEPGGPMHPRWFGQGHGIVYVSNHEGALCLYTRSFNIAARTFGVPVAVAHFETQRASINDVTPRAFNLSADGDTVYLNLGEQSSTIEVGLLKRNP